MSVSYGLKAFLNVLQSGASEAVLGGKIQNPWCARGVQAYLPGAEFVLVATSSVVLVHLREPKFELYRDPGTHTSAGIASMGQRLRP